MSKSSLLVIGLGGIGRWHARSFAAHDFDVFYIDPAVDDDEFIKLEHVGEFTGEVIIIATTSRFRYSYVDQIEAVFNNIKVILEKPLFVSLDEYVCFEQKQLRNDYVINLVFEPNIMGILGGEKRSHPDKVVVNGNDWGLACNILHDISMHGAFLDNIDQFEFLGSENLKRVASKRQGYCEVTGRVQFSLGSTYFDVVDNGCGPKRKTTQLWFGDECFGLSLYDSRVVHEKQGDVKTYDFQVPAASTDSFRHFAADLLPPVCKYLKVSKDLYTVIASELGFHGEFPFT